MFSVFRKALRDQRRMLILLSVSLAAYALLVMSFFPSIIEQAEDLNDLLESYPKEMMAMMYGGDVSEEFDIAEPGGYINSQFMLWVLLIVGAIVIVQVFNGFTNAERDGTMDLMLSLPISRREMLIGRVMSLFTGLLFILTICFLAFYASSVIWPEFDVPPADLALAIYGAFFPLAVIITFTLFLVSVIPSSKRFAGPIAYFFLLGSFLLHSFSQTVEGLKDLQPFFIFEYYSARNVILYGVEWSEWILLASVAAIFLGLASWFIDRKELGV